MILKAVTGVNASIRLMTSLANVLVIGGCHLLWTLSLTGSSGAKPWLETMILNLCVEKLYLMLTLELEKKGIYFHLLDRNVCPRPFP
jgi:hypothetical protein